MCVQCWEKYGSPAVDSPAVRAAAAAVAGVYEFSELGGNLHVYLDDWNLDLLGPNDDGTGGAAELIAANVWEGGPDQLAAERECLRQLLALDEDGRAAALGLYEGFWGGT